MVLPALFLKEAVMLVRATQMGYFEHRRRREDEVFDVPEKFFSKNWMQPVGEEEGEEAAPIPTVKKVGRPKKVVEEEEVL
jgi:hypothetical protein